MSLTAKIRVLIADDSAFMRKVLQSIISADAQLAVVGEARDGRDAVQQAESLKPDVITMDINMPVMDGLQATEQIMSSNPRPIVIVSSESRDGADITLKALALGAIDFVAKPNSGVDLDMNTVREEICRKLRMASKVRVVRTAAPSKLQSEIATSVPRTEPGEAAIAPAANTASQNGTIRPAGAVPVRPAGKFPIVVIAASTGGPATLMKMCPQFSPEFPGAVIIVQHMPGAFTSQYSQQLSGTASMHAKEAKAGEAIAPGMIYVCPGTHHLRISQAGKILLDDGPRINGYRPCADVALESAAEYAGPLCIGVVITGMGGDGAQGIQQVKALGGHVIAQDEATAVIFGMPSEAIKSGAVDIVAPLEEIVPAIEKRVLAVYGPARVGAL